MKKVWQNPMVLGLDVEQTNTNQGVYYKVSLARRPGVVCTGVFDINTGTHIQPCGEAFYGATLDQAIDLWREHAAVAHAGHPAYGEYMGITGTPSA